MDAKTDRELVLEAEPGAGLESRQSPLSGLTEYRVTHHPAHGRRDIRHAWSPTEALAWRAACGRLGLRIHRLAWPRIPYGFRRRVSIRTGPGGGHGGHRQTPTRGRRGHEDGSPAGARLPPRGRAGVPAQQPHRGGRVPSGIQPAARGAGQPGHLGVIRGPGVGGRVCPPRALEPPSACAEHIGRRAGGGHRTGTPT
jgi:hypothetical protein